MKKIKRLLLLHDWMWSVAIAFVCYWLLNLGPASINGVAMEYYAINWMQALLATAGIMAGLFAVARLGLWFNLQKIHHYVWGKRYKVPGSWEGAKEYRLFSFEDFKTLQPWQKLLLASVWVAFLFSAALVVFLKLLSAASVAP
ncbi:hypothetical protein SAMN05421788_101828 [Filimonas lacunae]|uniref:Uncharacterized protein n=1 Tax=Filimonas lacunae TaxID=477680 RepID=A0A173MPT2_9BACT|nr:hypothetical protein [Filimonas lacunae]BAV09391.1 hypothetical protein FLA_5439 [Filimonas lacunae]SIS72311.1 hypothetical protein SAMN05421788_101828 [Filimonas lacunae]